MRYDSGGFGHLLRFNGQCCVQAGAVAMTTRLDIYKGSLVMGLVAEYIRSTFIKTQNRMPQLFSQSSETNRIYKYLVVHLMLLFPMVPWL